MTCNAGLPIFGRFLACCLVAGFPGDILATEHALAPQAHTPLINHDQLASATASAVDARQQQILRPKVLGLPETVEAGARYHLWIDFGEQVTGVTADTINVSHDHINLVVGGPETFQAIVTPTGTADLVVTIPNAIAVGQPGRVFDAVTVSARVNAPSVAGVVESQGFARIWQQRAHSLMRNQPQLHDLIRRRRQLNFTASVKHRANRLDLVAETKSGLWARVSAKHRKIADPHDYLLGILGHDIVQRKNFETGAMLQADLARSRSGAIHGGGWLAGPYFVKKSAQHPLSFHGSVLVGYARFRYSQPAGSAVDAYARQALATFAISGKRKVDHLSIAPNITVTYLYGKLDGNAMRRGGDATMTRTEVDLNLDFDAPIIPGRDHLRHFAGLSVRWGGTSGLAGDDPPRSNPEHVRIHGGVSYKNEHGLIITTKGAVKDPGGTHTVVQLSAEVTFSF